MRNDIPNLAVDFCGLPLPTPLVLASGIWGTTVSLLVRLRQKTAAARSRPSRAVRRRAPAT
jgi:dihydroorotate dehydrogenase